MTAHAPARPAMVTVGNAVRWRGETYLVAALQGGSVHLLSQHAEGEDAVVLLDALSRSPDFVVLDTPGTGPDAATEGAPSVAVRQGLGGAAVLEGLSDKARERAEFWLDHVLEVHTGLPGFAAPGTAPRPCFDPERTTLRQRYETKAAELCAAHHRVSAATVERKRLAWLAQGVWGLVDKRRVRGPSTHGRVDEQVVKLLWKVHQRHKKRSVGTRSRLFELLRRACVRKFKKKAEQLMPSRATFYRLLERLGILCGRETGRQGSGSHRPEPPFTLAMATTPGEQVQIDTTPLDVLGVDETGRVVSLELTAAIDVATRTILAAVIRPKSSGTKTGPNSRRHGGRATKAVDALLLLAEMCTPQPMRPHWSPKAGAKGSDLPYAQLVEADERMHGAAARPVVIPEMIVMDNGKVFAGRAFMDACAQLGISVRPACYNSPTHKAIIERTFGSIKSLFSQFLPGYTGKDLHHRGKNVASERLWRVDQLNDFLQQWIAVGWQQRPHEELRNPFLPSMPPRTPNQMFAAHVASSGYVPVRLSAEDRLRLLPTAWVKVTDKGIRLNNRTYDSRAVSPYRNTPSGWPGKGQRWPVRYHPHQPEKVWLQDHRNGTWAEADFVYQRLIGDEWTAHVWDQATAAHLDKGGSTRDEAAIARVVRSLLERAGRGPSRTTTPQQAPVDRGMTVGPQPIEDPYRNIPAPNYQRITSLPSMDVDLRQLCLPPARFPRPDGLSQQGAGGQTSDARGPQPGI
ncbi:Mu transposase, C-terminal [Streptomyces sp. SceaMP-e96]|uniref:Mu transposase C-terminal domain-containing protein n=1 Tax=unclassified Streptomyces TaxID=2593676 RepID=UPI000823CDD5|nr:MULTISPECIES: Mu transposase C-terminal domain-containing protein [unclassified Streptomyces]MYT18275.1 DDE-type integrase/transposase/recombinase [Streptomyces sp. SID4951]SCK54193.1 Mu transposase, C-terminal [Streptomyces sp. SceaMP-e96]